MLQKLWGKSETERAITPSNTARLIHTGTNEGHFIAPLRLRRVTTTLYFRQIAYKSVLLLDVPKNVHTNTFS